MNKRYSVHTVEEVMPLLKASVSYPHRKRIGKYKVKVGGFKLGTFKKHGTVCLACGLEGAFFAVESQGNQVGKFLTLYGYLEDGTEIPMTADHVLAKAHGGRRSLSNSQTFCKLCNTSKGSMPHQDFMDKLRSGEILMPEALIRQQRLTKERKAKLTAEQQESRLKNRWSKPERGVRLYNLLRSPEGKLVPLPDGSFSLDSILGYLSPLPYWQQINEELLIRLINRKHCKLIEYVEGERKVRVLAPEPATPPPLPVEVPPEILYSETRFIRAEDTARFGLISTSNSYVTMSLGYDLKKKKGMLPVKIRAKALSDTGQSFYRTKKGRWLTMKVPPEYMEVIY